MISSAVDYEEKRADFFIGNDTTKDVILQKQNGELNLLPVSIHSACFLRNVKGCHQ